MREFRLRRKLTIADAAGTVELKPGTRLEVDESIPAELGRLGLFWHDGRVWVGWCNDTNRSFWVGRICYAHTVLD